MRTFSCFVTDDRYSVPTLTFLLVADPALARELALRRLLECPHHRKVEIRPGPNNPVGSTWLGLSKPHWGIHGTPEPSRVGRLETHGCLRLRDAPRGAEAHAARPAALALLRVDCPVLLSFGGAARERAEAD